MSIVVCVFLFVKTVCVDVDLSSMSAREKRGKLNFSWLVDFQSGLGVSYKWFFSSTKEVKRSANPNSEGGEF